MKTTIIICALVLIAGLSYAYNPFILNNGKQTSPYSSEGGGMFGESGNSGSGPTSDALILENGDYLLLENGDKLLLE